MLKKMLLLSLVLAAGCAAQPPKIAQQGDPSKADYVPGIMEYQRGWAWYTKPHGKDFSLLQQKKCYKTAIPHLRNAYEAMSEKGKPGTPEFEKWYPQYVTYLMMAYRDLAAVQSKLADEAEAEKNYTAALAMCDVLEKRYHGKMCSNYYRGYIYYLQRKYADAERELKKDIELRPHVPGRRNVKLLEYVREAMEEDRYRLQPQPGR